MDERRFVGRAVTLLVLGIWTSLILTGVGAAGGDIGDSTGPTNTDVGVTEVAECRTITEPGRYVLTGDIRDSTASDCITIVASDVIFDGQGHVIDASGDHAGNHSAAIAAGYTDPAIENVTIKNLVVTDWIQGVGCRAVAADVTVANVTARRNGQKPTGGLGNEYGQSAGGYAIYVGDMTHNVTVRDSTVVNNSLGVFIANTTNNIVRNNLIRNNTLDGVLLGSSTWNNTVIANRIVGNGMTGISVSSRPQRDVDSPHTTIHNNRLRANTHGLVLKHTTTAVTVSNNTFVNTTKESIEVKVVDGNVTVVNNSLLAGNSAGILLDAASHIEIRDNLLRNLSGPGLRLVERSTNNRITGNRIVDAAGGLRVTDDSGLTTVRHLVVVESRGPAIRFDGRGQNVLRTTTIRGGRGIDIHSSNNHLRNLTVLDTQHAGISLVGADNTSIEGVTMRNLGGSAIEADSRSTNVTIGNLSLASGRVSLSFSGIGVGVAPVSHIPPAPSDQHTIGVAVRVRTAPASTDTGSGTRSDLRNRVVLTVYYPERAANVTLWRRPFGGDWAPFDDTTTDSAPHAISASIPAGANLVVVPLSPAPLVTPTAAPTATDSAGLPEFSIPGFGIGVALLALVMLGGIAAHSTRS